MTSWPDFIAQQKQETYLKTIFDSITQQRIEGKTIYPQDDDIFRAFITTPLNKTKVVILGQDPYHGENQAHGLSFSVNDGVKIPPSLVNMYKELSDDIEGFQIPTHGNLTAWAEQGVLLLNTVLTVEAKQAHSHKKLGWETFTDRAISLIDDTCAGVVFILWGAHAQKKGKNINREKHLVLNGPHPSPLSAYRGFFGCRHFSQANQYLMSQGKTPIDWRL